MVLVAPDPCREGKLRPVCQEASGAGACALGTAPSGNNERSMRYFPHSIVVTGVLRDGYVLVGASFGESLHTRLNLVSEFDT